MKVSFSEGNYLKAADITQPVLVTLKSATMVSIEQGEQPKVVVTFNEMTKPLILNKTNGNTILGLYGDDTDRWQGQPIEVYATVTSFNGRQVPCLRLRPPSGQQPQHAMLAAPQYPAAAQPQYQPPAAPPQQVIPQQTPPAPAQQAPQYQEPSTPQPPIQAPAADVPFDA